MKKVLWLIVCLMTMVIGLSSCGTKNEEKTTYLEEKVGEIADKYSAWADNDLATEPFKNEMVSLFSNSKGMDFSEFYGKTIEFDEIIETPKRHVNNSDSVAVRFKLFETCFSKENNHVSVSCDVIAKFPKEQAINFKRDVEYKMQGKILGFIEDVDLWDKSDNRIEMGYIMMENKCVDVFQIN